MQITIYDDFDPEKIAVSGQCFRVTRLEDDTYRFLCGSRFLYIKQIDNCVYETDCTEDTWRDFWHGYFDLDRDYHSVRRAVRSGDPCMLAAADAGAGIRILRQDPWETVVTFIISQRKSIPAIKRCVELLASNFGEKIDTGRETVCGFPSPEALLHVPREKLIQCGLGYRTPYIEDALHKVSSGKLNLNTLFDYDDASLLTALKTVHGIGDKVANCISLFAYGRTSLAPVDTWIGRVIEEKYDGIDPFPEYGDMAGIMQQYIFYYAQIHKEKFKIH